MLLDLQKPQDFDLLVDRLAEALHNRQQNQPQPKHITFKEARTELKIEADALRRRIQDNHIPTYWMNGGKAFDRKHLQKLM